MSWVRVFRVVAEQRKPGAGIISANGQAPQATTMVSQWVGSREEAETVLENLIEKHGDRIGMAAIEDKYMNEAHVTAHPPVEDTQDEHGQA